MFDRHLNIHTKTKHKIIIAESYISYILWPNYRYLALCYGPLSNNWAHVFYTPLNIHTNARYKTEQAEP
jgi:hypothetical protein